MALWKKWTWKERCAFFKFKQLAFSLSPSIYKVDAICSPFHYLKENSGHINGTDGTEQGILWNTGSTTSRVRLGREKVERTASTDDNATLTLCTEYLFIPARLEI